MSFNLHIKTATQFEGDSEFSNKSESRVQFVKSDSTKKETLFIEDYLLPCTPNEKVRHLLVEGSLHLYKNTIKGEHSHSNLGLILNVPDYMGIVEVFEFLNEKKDKILYFRCIRQDRTDSDYLRSQMMILIKVDGAIDEFIDLFHGKTFSLIDNQVCNILKIKDVYVHPKSPILEAMIELPNCPVCLEKIDTGTSGVMTILCNHTFHCDCLLKWGNSCPVCRNIEVNTPCALCIEENYEAAFKDSWICLICGNVGCGRYNFGHAYLHFQSSNHCFALEIKTQRVWDYQNDGFVHRLIQGDGKIVPTDPLSIQKDESEKPKNDLALLLTTQLDSQRHYFEKQILEKDNELQILSAELKKCIEKQEELKLILKSDAIEKEKMKASSSKLIHENNSYQSQLAEETALYESLLKNQKSYKAAYDIELKSKDAIICDLKEQINDLMFYLQAQEKISKLNDEDKKELEEGSIILKKKKKK
eukprot:NODE_480_length_6952_cov_0.771487.p2 type:complete len:474 gc:universal NODE_480_length_6952_cov_0.771487:2641-1220(-)